MNIHLNIVGELALKKQLALLKLPDPKKKRLINRCLTRLRTQWRKRTAAQLDMNNNAFEKRKDKKRSKKNKMLTGLTKLMTVTSVTAQQGVLGWKVRKTAVIARAHNEGAVTKGSAEELQRLRRAANKPASDQQLKQLKRLGYQIKKGKRLVKPSVTWLKDNMNYDKAGKIIRLLSPEKARKRTWDIRTPKREFFGADKRQVNELIGLLLDQVTGSPN